LLPILFSTCLANFLHQVRRFWQDEWQPGSPRTQPRKYLLQDPLAFGQRKVDNQLRVRVNHVKRHVSDRHASQQRDVNRLPADALLQLGEWQRAAFVHVPRDDLAVED
jgi:hypothetical protein